MDAGHVVAGRYRLLRRLGEGAMGVVWAATNVYTDRTVALKLIPRGAVGGAELRVRMLREARACGRIQHRNVVEIYDVGQTDGGDPFLVMQLLRGETLESRLRRAQGGLPGSEVVAIALSIARALAAAHASGIIHRDLKPANVFLHREPDQHDVTVKVLDFGVSKVLAADPAAATITGTAIGSPAYMSPEQARGAAGLEPRSDVWAFGAVLVETLTGHIAFRGDTAYEAVGEILHGEIPRVIDLVAGVDRRLAELVSACLERDVSLRPTANELVAMLERIHGAAVEAPRHEATLPVAACNATPKASATSTTPMLREAPSPSRRRRTAVAALLLSAAVLCGVFYGVVVVRSTPTPVQPKTSQSAYPAAQPSASTASTAPGIEEVFNASATAPVNTAAPTASASVKPTTKTKKPPAVRPSQTVTIPIGPLIPDSPG